MYLQILLLHEKTEQSNTVTVYIRENSRKHGVLARSDRLPLYAEGDPEDIRTIFGNCAGVGKKYRKNK